jgi:hypothetical protein
MARGLFVLGLQERPLSSISVNAYESYTLRLSDNVCSNDYIGKVSSLPLQHLVVASSRGKAHLHGSTPARR